ncbi:hypothetical protein A9Q87_13120 [Flavobacteriales bacterium 34_180_T64]|nr:hypothetical protein A9Q87_13120 [Flavobacteriales bacterium 34_180_T64]
MKKILLLVICVFSLNMFGQDTTNNWSNDYKTVLETAKSQNKAIVFYFIDADNSEKDRLIQSELFGSQEFKSLASKVVLLKVYSLETSGLSEAQRAYSKRLIGHYNPQNKFPASVTVDANEMVIATLNEDINTAGITTYLTVLKSGL